MVPCSFIHSVMCSVMPDSTTCMPGQSYPSIQAKRFQEFHVPEMSAYGTAQAPVYIPRSRSSRSSTNAAIRISLLDLLDLFCFFAANTITAIQRAHMSPAIIQYAAMTPAPFPARRQPRSPLINPAETRTRPNQI